MKKIDQTDDWNVINIVILTHETHSKTRLLGAQVMVDGTVCGTFPSNEDLIEDAKWYTF